MSVFQNLCRGFFPKFVPWKHYQEGISRRFAVKESFSLVRLNSTNSHFYAMKVRIFGEAIELNAEQISKLWESEPVLAKIRSRICECGKPVDPADLSRVHDDLLKAYQEGKDKLPQTPTYTALKIVPKVWDFHKGKRTCITVRVVYKKQEDTNGTTWNLRHVAS